MEKTRLSAGLIHCALILKAEIESSSGEGLALLILMSSKVEGAKMIKQLTVRNFRGIKEGTIELSPLTILLGANNSGKSTILEALFLAPNPLREVPYQTPLGRNLALSTVYFLHQTLQYQGYAFLLHNYTSDESQIECDLNGDKYSLRFIKNSNRIFLCTNKELDSYRGTINFKKENIRYFGDTYINSLSMDGNSNLIIGETLLVNPNLIKPCYTYLSQIWAPIINTGIMRKVASDASKLSPEIYRDLTMEPFIGGMLDIYVMMEDGKRIRLGDLGDGIQRYIISKILFEWVKPEVLLWDDMESHFNPRILRHIAEWFTDLLNHGKQVVLSTHSLEAVKVIAGVNEEESRIYLTSLEGSIFKTKKLTLSDLENLEKAGIDPRTAEAFLL